MNPTPGGGCGYFQPLTDSHGNLDGGYINIYGHTNTNPPYDCSQELNFVIEHEMGHGDPSNPSACVGWVMGAPSSPTAGIAAVSASAWPG